MATLAPRTRASRSDLATGTLIGLHPEGLQLAGVAATASNTALKSGFVLVGAHTSAWPSQHSRAKPKLACQYFVQAKIEELDPVAWLQLRAGATAEQVVQGNIPVHKALGVALSEALQGQAHAVRASAVPPTRRCSAWLPRTAYPCAVKRQQVAQ